MCLVSMVPGLTRLKSPFALCKQLCCMNVFHRCIQICIRICRCRSSIVCQVFYNSEYMSWLISFQSGLDVGLAWFWHHCPENRYQVERLETTQEIFGEPELVAVAIAKLHKKLKVCCRCRCMALGAASYSRHVDFDDIRIISCKCLVFGGSVGS
jgi:hypothetical protein